VQLHLLYVVDFTPVEKHSRFLLQPAQQATHDNRLCFVKTVNISKNRHSPVTPNFQHGKKLLSNGLTQGFILLGGAVEVFVRLCIHPPSKEFHTDL